jgi:hypothetical protein
MLLRALARFSGRRQAESSPRRIRWWAIGIVGAVALVLGFLVTLWLINPAGPPGPAAKSMTQTLP